MDEALVDPAEVDRPMFLHTERVLEESSELRSIQVMLQKAENHLSAHHPAFFHSFMSEQKLFPASDPRPDASRRAWPFPPGRPARPDNRWDGSYH